MSREWQTRPETLVPGRPSTRAHNDFKYITEAFAKLREFCKSYLEIRDWAQRLLRKRKQSQSLFQK